MMEAEESGGSAPGLLEMSNDVADPLPLINGLDEIGEYLPMLCNRLEPLYASPRLAIQVYSGSNLLNSIGTYLSHPDRLSKATDLHYHCSSLVDQVLIFHSPPPP